MTAHAVGARDFVLRSVQEVHVAAARWPRRVPAPRRDGAAALRSLLPSIRRRAEQDLAANILPFWRGAVDSEHGGFVTYLDRYGRWSGPTDKHLVMQARVIWTFAAAHRFGLDRDGYLDIAGAGVRFLLEHMWDREHGGFYWTVSRDGTPIDTRKRVYGQGFAMYALAEYAAAADDERALQRTGELFRLLLARAEDASLGFREEFLRDWRAAPGPLGSRKTLDTHLHLLEPLIAMTRAGRWTEPVSVLKQTLEVLFTRAVAPRECYAPDVFDLSWRPAADWRHRRRANYGHDAELAWLTLEALELVGWTHSCKRDRALDLVAHALTYGFDHARGGLAHYGPPAGATVHAAYLHPARLNKLWWPQAEMLVGLLDAYRLTRETRYLAAFVKQFEWVWERQIDHDGGEWFAEVTWRDGRPVRLTKGDDWKDPYHQSRGWMEVSRRLRAMGVA